MLINALNISILNIQIEPVQVVVLTPTLPITPLTNVSSTASTLSLILPIKDVWIFAIIILQITQQTNVLVHALMTLIIMEIIKFVCSIVPLPIIMLIQILDSVFLDAPTSQRVTLMEILKQGGVY